MNRIESHRIRLGSAIRMGCQRRERSGSRLVDAHHHDSDADRISRIALHRIDRLRAELWRRALGHRMSIHMGRQRASTMLPFVLPLNAAAEY